MTDLLEDVIRNVVLSKVRQHGLELALVPALGDTGSHVEVVTRYSEKVLAFVDTVGKVVGEGAVLSYHLGVGLAVVTPGKCVSVVVSPGLVVVVEDGSLVVSTS